MLKLIRQNLTLLVAIAVAIAGAVWYGLGDHSPEPLLATETAEGTSDQQLVSTLLALRTVSLDGTIFVNPGFMALRDFGSQIVPEPVGRANPFAPLSGAVLATTTEQTDGGASRSGANFVPIR